MRSRLEAWTRARGCRLACCEPDAVTHALEHLVSLRGAGRFDALFYERSLAWFESTPAGIRPDDRSILLIAVPRPAHLVTFEYRGRSHELLLPPTYYDYTGFFEEVRSDLDAYLEGRLPLRLVKAPYKTLVTRTGFARYGRNNITYLRGLGSYVQWMVFATSMRIAGPVLEEIREPRMLERCRRCDACRKTCPSRAIGSERFLLEAENCVTWFSEFEGPLPDAFGAARRPCLVGCMACQEACPANAGLLRLEKLAVRFTEEETTFLLGEASMGGESDGRRDESSVRTSAAEKLVRLRCSGWSMSPSGPPADFRRNLAAVLRH